MSCLKTKKQNVKKEFFGYWTYIRCSNCTHSVLCRTFRSLVAMRNSSPDLLAAGFAQDPLCQGYLSILL